MEIEQRELVFAKELDLISEVRIREFTKLCIASAPDYIFTDCPASSTGKYHPLNELSWDGVLIHTKKVFHLAFELTRGLGIEKDRDSVLSACLIHDLLKKGRNNNQWVQQNHPQLAAELVTKIQRDTQLLNEEEFGIIYNSIFNHYGPWTSKADAKPMSEFTLHEMCLYVSDFVSSKRFIDIQYKDIEHE